MYPPPRFKSEAHTHARASLRARPFGGLVGTEADSRPCMTKLLLRADGGQMRRPGQVTMKATYAAGKANEGDLALWMEHPGRHGN